jgi:HSP20 family protein
MATQEMKADEKQNEHSQAQEAPRNSEHTALGRRAAFPITLVRPVDFFRINPFSLMRRMTEEMDRVFGDGSAREGNGEMLWSPAVEISQGEGNYVVRAELAGLKPDDVKLEIENDALVLHGERKYEREEEKGGVRRTEMRYGRFYRTIPLPEGANPDQARAKYENGVLEVTIPVSEPKNQRKQIAIQTGPGAAASTTAT